MFPRLYFQVKKFEIEFSNSKEFIFVILRKSICNDVESGNNEIIRKIRKMLTFFISAKI